MSAPAAPAVADSAGRAQLQRLFSPRHIAVFGGASAAEAVRQCRKLGFAGQIWPVHPTRASVEGLACYPDVASLPQAPDASFVAVPRHATVDIVGQLAARGAGGVICYASGFAEVGGEGVALQQQLVHNAGEMALLGPNCYGMLNYLDGAAPWPDQHGGQRVERGVALITQSGNIGLNLTMQRRALPLAYLITVGNKAGSSMESLVDALLADPRVSVIGMHIEGLDDVAAFSRVALKALRQGVPLVALKAGRSAISCFSSSVSSSPLSTVRLTVSRPALRLIASGVPTGGGSISADTATPDCDRSMMRQRWMAPSAMVTVVWALGGMKRGWTRFTMSASTARWWSPIFSAK